MNTSISINYPIIIGISGLARSGKTTTANILFSYLNSIGYHCSLVSMADPIKSALSQLGIFKNSHDMLYRTLAQHIGDKCREADPDWFIKIFRDTVETKNQNSNILKQKAIYICDDIRFENELKNSNIFTNPILSLYIHRPSLDLTLPVYQHISEKMALDHLTNLNPLINFTLTNNVELTSYTNEVVIPFINTLGFINAS